MMMMAKVLAVLVALVPGMAAITARSLKGPDSPALGVEPVPVEPEPQQEHPYTRKAQLSLHVARGEGLHAATTGVPASFTIELVGEGNAGSLSKWSQGGQEFIYVWIASQDQILNAQVVNNGNGTLTATYESSFPGDYLVYVEEVVLKRHDEGRPIAGSPFELKITGEPVLDVDELPVCGSEEDDIESSFWRPGTWVSSRLASAPHGTMRNGWVFQPKSCVYDAFTYDDLMLLASLPEETSLLVLGGSVQRGLFLTLVDMMLSKEQKPHLIKSTIQKCWGYASVKVGNLRVTYQDLRLYTINKVEVRDAWNVVKKEPVNGSQQRNTSKAAPPPTHADVVICNNEKLASGSSAHFVQSCKDFLAETAFGGGTVWPSVIFAPSNLEHEERPNLATKVLIGALPPSWEGTLILADHMAGLGNHWKQRNPTLTTLEEVGMSYHRQPFMGNEELGQMRRYQESNPCVEFMSAFPMYQAKLFENQESKHGFRMYGRSVHYHYVSADATDSETHGGTRMVQSTMTEMLANIMISKAVGSKAALYERAQRMPEGSRRGPVGELFEVAHDCPASLLPFHVKPIPEPTLMTVESLPSETFLGEVWDREVCPSWCMEQEPVSETPTESGPVYVRECRAET